MKTAIELSDGDSVELSIGDLLPDLQEGEGRGNGAVC
jgi:hypothetical protein